MNEFMTPRKQEMKFKDAVSRCHVRSAIYRKGESACYRCLLEYDNQRYHALIDRYLAVDTLDNYLY